MRAAIAAFVSLVTAGCLNEENLGNTLEVVDSGTQPPPSPIDAAPSVDPAPDANPPHTEVWWAPSLGVVPEQACDPWGLDDSASANPVLGVDDLVLATTSGETMAYGHRGAQLTPIVPETLRIGAEVRLISGETRAQFRYHGWTGGLTISDGAVTSDGGTTYAMATTDAAHVYQLEVDLWTGQVIVKADQIVISTEWAATAGSGSAEVVEFGQFAPGTSAWGSIWHNVHAITNCPVQ